MKVIKITTDDEISIVEISRIDELEHIVDGYVERVHCKGLKEPYRIICNEEGLPKKLPLNNVGSFLYGTPLHGNPIVGDIAVIKMGYTANGFDYVDMTNEEAIAMKAGLMTRFEFLHNPKTDTEKAIEAQKEYCGKVGTIMFSPGYDGNCFHCMKNIYRDYGASKGYTVEDAGSKVITDCPHCHYSFVD